MKTKKRQAGQSLAEFALMTPVLLFVLMATIDFGRVLLTYTQTSAAVRNALRYGIIIGLNEGSQNYLDCAGITSTASQALFSDLDQVTVFYERPTLYTGDTTTGDITCDGSLTDNDIENGDILVVRVESDVSFLTPFVPFDSLPVDIEGHRTLVKQVDIDTVANASSTDNVPLVAIVLPDPVPDLEWTDVEGNSITFVGFANDTEDGNISAAIEWEIKDNSDTVVYTYTGETFDYALMTEADQPYTVKASITDTDGHTRTDSLVVNVIASTSDPPDLTDSSPAKGATILIPASAQFNAVADDLPDPPEDGDLTADIAWYIDGSLAYTGGSFSMTTGTVGSGADLGPGDHTALVVVEDSSGLRDSDYFTFTVVDPANTIPVVDITVPDPADAAFASCPTAGTPCFDVADSITFTATANDPDEANPDLSPNIRWTLQPSGKNLGTGGTITIDAVVIAPGIHTVRASATDSTGVTGFDEIDIEVEVTYNTILATLHIWVNDEEGGSYLVQRITGAWTENTVTWDSLFGGGYTLSATGHSFSTASRNVGEYKIVEITSLVENWINDSATYPNDGLLIDADSNIETLDIASREALGGIRAPYIQVYVNDGVSTYQCDRIFATADAYVSEQQPGVNFGGSGTTTLTAHQQNNRNKHILLRFDTLLSDYSTCASP